MKFYLTLFVMFSVNVLASEVFKSPSEYTWAQRKAIYEKLVGNRAAYVSEEVQTKVCPSGDSAVSIVSCRGKFCDDIHFGCGDPESWTAPKTKNVTTLVGSNDSASHVITKNYASDEWFKEKLGCPVGYVVTGFKCIGSHCDNVKLACSQYEGYPYACEWSQPFSEETHGRYENVVVLEDNARILGVECPAQHRFCDEKRLFACAFR